MEELLSALSSLDGSQNSVENAAGIFLNNPNAAEDMVAEWCDALEGTQERIPLLFVANDILLRNPSIFAPPFLHEGRIQRAITTTCNFPGDRDQVCGLLRVWQEFSVFPSQILDLLWKLTGEIEEENVSINNNLLRQSSHQSLTTTNSELQTVSLETSFNPILKQLQEMDRNVAILTHVKEKLNYQKELEMLTNYAQLLTTPEQIVDIMKTSATSEIPGLNVSELKDKIDRAVAGHILMQVRTAFFYCFFRCNGLLL